MRLRLAPPHTGSPAPFGPGTPEESEKSPERVPRARSQSFPGFRARRAWETLCGAGPIAILEQALGQRVANWTGSPLLCCLWLKGLEALERHPAQKGQFFRATLGRVHTKATGRQKGGFSKRVGLANMPSFKNGPEDFARKVGQNNT